MNYYERHIGDYLKDTAHLSLLEHGVYTRLLDVYYTREGGIPAKEVARLIGARSRDEKEALQAVLEEFFSLDAELWIQVRSEAEIARYKGKREKASASANARWGKSERNANASPDDDANDMRTNIERNATRAEAGARPQSPVTSNQSSESKIPADTAPRGAKPAFGLSQLIAEGVDPKHAADWIAVRKAKRLPLTPTAWEKTKREANKAGITAAAAVQRCAENGWAGFGATWVADDPGSPNQFDGAR